MKKNIQLIATGSEIEYMYYNPNSSYRVTNYKITGCDMNTISNEEYENQYFVFDVIIMCNDEIKLNSIYPYTPYVLNRMFKVIKCKRALLKKKELLFN